MLIFVKMPHSERIKHFVQKNLTIIGHSDKYIRLYQAYIFHF